MNLQASIPYDSPIGTLHLAVDNDGKLRWCDIEPPPPDCGWNLDLGGCRQAVRDLEGYFSGRSESFSLSPLPSGSSDNNFTGRVLAALGSLPYGRVSSYGTLAEAAGNPKAARAAGSIISTNHLLIFIPCHRVLPAASVYETSISPAVKAAYRTVQQLDDAQEPKTLERRRLLRMVGGYRGGSAAKMHLLELEGLLQREY